MLFNLGSILQPRSALNTVDCLSKISVTAVVSFKVLNPDQP